MDMITTVRFRLTVKPMFRNNMKRADPMPWRSMGTELMTARKLGATKRPVPTPSNIMYILRVKKGVPCPVVENKNNATVLKTKPESIN